ncbi:MAG: hypothetical protein WHV44_12580 [Anaerolineales bacterium]
MLKILAHGLIAVLALFGGIFLTVLGFQERDAALGVFGVSVVFVALAYLMYRLGIKSQHIFPNRLLSVGLFGLLLSVLSRALGWTGMLILGGIVLAVLFAFWLFVRRQRTLYRLLKSRLSLLGFTEVMDAQSGSYEFTRQGIVIRETRLGKREVEIYCAAPWVAPFRQTFPAGAEDQKLAAITRWLLENNIMDLEKEYAEAYHREYMNRR